MGEPSTTTLNLKQVAAELGVHYMTAYRYVRTGRLEADKIGNGWVVHPGALDRFVGETSTDDETPSVNRTRADWSGRLAQALVTGDETAAWRVLQQALASGRSSTDCYLDILTPALQSLSATNAEDGSSQEYLATATATRLVARLGAQFRKPGRSRGTVVFGAPLGEHHSLPIAIVADLIRIEGFTCLELGADVPAAVFAHAATIAPRLVAVGVGVTTAANVDAVQATITAVRAAAPAVPVVLGGQAVLNPEIAQLVGATHWAPDGAGALEIIAAIRGDQEPGTDA